VKVVIVDGNARVRSRLGERFTEEGLVVVLASEAEAAIAAVDSGAPTAVVFDVHVAGETGIEVLERLRRHAPRATIVVLTNEANELHRSECLRRGADFFCDKSRDFDHAVVLVLEAARAATGRS
jgi:two-component system response regulator DevR